MDQFLQAENGCNGNFGGFSALGTSTPAVLATLQSTDAISRNACANFRAGMALAPSSRSVGEGHGGGGHGGRTPFEERTREVLGYTGLGVTLGLGVSVLSGGLLGPVPAILGGLLGAAYGILK